MHNSCVGRKRNRLVPSDPRSQFAWWTDVVEPGDLYSHVLRAAIGEEAAIAWALADGPSSLPPQLMYTEEGEEREWYKVWHRWRPRVLEANPERHLQWIYDRGGKFLIPTDEEWPQKISILGSVIPIGLWVLGSMGHLPTVSIVGCRACTPYGTRVASEMAMNLSDHSVSVISGGAFGIDIAAHRGALVGRDGGTIAVMAGGLDRLYPSSHENYFNEMLDHPRSGIISEVPPSWRPAKWRFLSRNRLIAALSAVTVVVEAAPRSGALATARWALDLNRHVGAVPGDATSLTSQGCHRLLREGAVLIRDWEDITELLDGLLEIRQEAPFGDPVEKDCGTDAFPPILRRVWEALTLTHSATLEAIARSSGQSMNEVSAALGRLELEGYVHRHLDGWCRQSDRR